MSQPREDIARCHDCGEPFPFDELNEDGLCESCADEATEQRIIDNQVEAAIERSREQQDILCRHETPEGFTAAQEEARRRAF